MYSVSVCKEIYDNSYTYRFNQRWDGFGAPRERRNKTVYDNEGFAWVVDTETGEIRMKKRGEIERVCVASIKRTHKRLMQIIEANEWLYFATFTFNDSQQNRMNDNEVIASFETFRKWLKRCVPGFYYLAVVERHKDGVIHLHMLGGGASREELRLVTPKDFKKRIAEADKKYNAKVAIEKRRDRIADWHMNTYKNRDKSGRAIYCFETFCKRGKNEVTLIENQEAVKHYVTKYISKALGSCTDMFKKSYYVSRNCKRPEIERMEVMGDRYMDMLRVAGVVLNRAIVPEDISYFDPEHSYLRIDCKRDLDTEKVVDFKLVSGVGAFEPEQVKPFVEGVEPPKQLNRKANTYMIDYFRARKIDAEREKIRAKSLPAWVREIDGKEVLDFDTYVEHHGGGGKFAR